MNFTPLDENSSHDSDHSSGGERGGIRCKICSKFVYSKNSVAGMGYKCATYLNQWMGKSSDFSFAERRERVLSNFSNESLPLAKVAKSAKLGGGEAAIDVVAKIGHDYLAIDLSRTDEIYHKAAFNNNLSPVEHLELMSSVFIPRPNTEIREVFGDEELT